MSYTAEDYIRFIEMGRYDKISPNALEIIANKYRELEADANSHFGMPGYGDYTPVLEDQEEVELILVNPCSTKLLLVKYLKEELDVSLRHAKDLIDNSPSLLTSAKPKISNGELSTEYKNILDIKQQLNEMGCTVELH